MDLSIVLFLSILSFAYSITNDDSPPPHECVVDALQKDPFNQAISPHDYFVTYISLPNSHDRRRKLLDDVLSNEPSLSNLTSPHIVNVIHEPHVTLSHIHALLKCKESHKKYCLIFEDDVIWDSKLRLSKLISDTIMNANHVFGVNQFDVILLGHNINGTSRKGTVQLKYGKLECEDIAVRIPDRVCIYVYIYMYTF